MEFDLVYYLPLFMFAALGILLFSGYPVAFVLGGVGLAEDVEHPHRRRRRQSAART